MLNALRRFFLNEQRIVTLRTLSRYRFEIDNELAFGIALTGVKRFAKARAALDKLSFLTLRTGD